MLTIFHSARTGVFNMGKMTIEMYQLQMKRRMDDPQVGDLLKDINHLQQIICTNSGQFFIFYEKYMGATLPNTMTLEEINRLKIEIIGIELDKMKKAIRKGEYHHEEYEEK